MGDMTAVVLGLVVLLAPESTEDLLHAYREAVAARDWEAACGAARGLAGGDEGVAVLQADLKAATEDAHRRVLIAALVRADFSGVESFLNAHGASEDPYVRVVVLEA